MPRRLPKPGMVGNLFSGHHEPTGWTAPAELPDLSNYPMEAKFGFDLETTSKNPFTAIQVGMAICTPDKRKFYLPHGHRGGGNLDENSIKKWAKYNLAGRHLCILNAKYDVPITCRWGLDLESIGCHLHDPAFKAALLDENRRKFNLDILSSEILGKSKSEPSGSKADIADMAASEAGSYAEDDAELHYELDTTLAVEIHNQDLDRVCDLEDKLIYSTIAMEQRGALIDRPKLERWVQEVSLAHQEAILQLYSISGMKINPNSGDQLKKLFIHLNIPLPKREEEFGGEETFEEEYLLRVQHPIVRLIMAAKKLDSLNSKYLKKYLKALDHNNILRYSLHQLRGGEYGTVTGRYASANVNIQQVYKVESQLEEEAIARWLVRELFIPEPGKKYISADASQIEFRWFTHYSRAKRLIDTYVNDPNADFHQLVADMLSQTRKNAKTNNFGKIYTMGIGKLARSLGLSCNCGIYWEDVWNRSLHKTNCRILKAFDLNKEYDTKFPEAKILSKKAMDEAKKIGFVKTVMGRRRRYPTGERLHSALNAIIQGTAADTLKVKLLETYNNSKFLTIDLRATVHDELDGDISDVSKEKQFKELLEAPDSRIPCSVPLIWDVVVGDNWRECTE